MHKTYRPIYINILIHLNTHTHTHTHTYIYIYIYTQHKINKFPDFFRMGTFIDRTHEILVPSK